MAIELVRKHAKSGGGGEFPTSGNIPGARTFTGNLTIDRSADSALASLSIAGAGTGFTHADLRLTATAVGRGLGIYLANNGDSKNWFMGNPYAAGGPASDSFVINRRATASSILQLDTADPNDADVVRFMNISSTGAFTIGPTTGNDIIQRVQRWAGFQVANGTNVGATTSFPRLSAMASVHNLEAATGGPFTVHGIYANNNDSNYNGVVLWLINRSGQSMTLAHNSGTATNTNERIFTRTGANVVIPNAASAMLMLCEIAGGPLGWSLVSP